MILIGMFDSTFVRRVAVSMNLLQVPFEPRHWSVGKDFELIRQFNPLGRVPALVQADGDTLIESAAILDFLDESAGPERALLPPSGEPRRETLRIIAIGAAEKGVSQLSETAFWPPEKRYTPWVERSGVHAATVRCAAEPGTPSAHLTVAARSRARTGSTSPQTGCFGPHSRPDRESHHTHDTPRS
jgi:glutathione S-transferase